MGLDQSSYFVDFTKVKSIPSGWTSALYETTNFGANGAEFTFAKRHDAPTIFSNFFFFFGHIEYVVQAAPGIGIISSMVLQSDDLDEIDWEFTGTNDKTVQTNYFGKGYLNYEVGQYVEGKSPHTEFHTYSLDWSPTELVWSINGVPKRTLTAATAGDYYPQTPMQIKLGLWDGGDPDQPLGTQQWAGGVTPLPPKQNYTMYVKSVRIDNTYPAKYYQYVDNTGGWKSIKASNESIIPSSSLSSTSSSAPSPSSSTGKSTGYISQVTTTSIPEVTVLSTKEIVITSCAANVKDCPARSTPITSHIVVSSVKAASISTLSTVDKVTSEVVYTTVTNCSVTNTKTMGGTSTVMVTTLPSTILNTKTVSSNLTSGATVTSEVVYTTVTTCPLTSTTVSLGSTSVVVANGPSTILSTSTVTSNVTKPVMVTSEVVYTTVTSCPVTTTKLVGATTSLIVTASLSTILSTETKTLCTKCVAPHFINGASIVVAPYPNTTSPAALAPTVTPSPSVAAAMYHAYTAAHVSCSSIPGFVQPIATTVQVTHISTVANASSTKLATTVVPSVVFNYAQPKTRSSTVYSTLHTTSFTTVVDGASSTHVSSTVIPSIVPIIVEAPASMFPSTIHSMVDHTQVSTVVDSKSSTSLLTTVIPSIVTTIAAVPTTKTISSTIYSTIYNTQINTVVGSMSATSLITTLIPNLVYTITEIKLVDSTVYSTIYSTSISTMIDPANSATSLSTTIVPSVLFTAMAPSEPAPSSIAAAAANHINPINGHPLPVSPSSIPSTITTTPTSTSTTTARRTSTTFYQANGSAVSTGVVATAGGNFSRPTTGTPLMQAVSAASGFGARGGFGMMVLAAGVLGVFL